MINEINIKKIQKGMVKNRKIKAILFAENDNNAIAKYNLKENNNRKEEYGFGFFV